jgi:NADH-quinone oxidoreductase subunit N
MNKGKRSDRTDGAGVTWPVSPAALVASFQSWMSLPRSASTATSAPSRSDLKRLLGYSSIAQAGYLLLGVAALNDAGRSAILFYLAGYLFSVLAAFTVICVVTRKSDNADISELAGLHQRSPLLAVAMTLAMVSLAGIPPLAGFFGKFLLIKSVLANLPGNSGWLWLTLVALVGVVISFYYYFGVIRAIYWDKDAPAMSPIALSWPITTALAACIAGMLYLGIYPATVMGFTDAAVRVLK